MNKTFKKITAAVMAVATLTTGITGISAIATEPNKSILEYNTNSANARTYGSISFNVTQITNYGTFVASKSTITASFNNCSAGCALVKIHKNGYTGSVVGSFVVPAGSGVPTQYYYINATVGTKYYITIEPHLDYFQAVGIVGLDY